MRPIAMLLAMVLPVVVAAGCSGRSAEPTPKAAGTSSDGPPADSPLTPPGGGGSAPAVATVAFPEESEWPVAVTRFVCPEGADCAPTYEVGGARGGLSCAGRVKDDRVSPRVIGSGAAEVRAVVGVDPELFVAIRTAFAPDCGSGWWPLFVGQGRPDAMQAAVCDALELTDEQRYADGCPGAPVIAPPRTPH